MIGLFSLLYLLREDPAPGLRHSKASSRRYECTWYDDLAANARHPGRVPVSPPNGDSVERSVMICAERLLPSGLRSSRDEAILSGLSARVTELVAAATQLYPELRSRTWLVESYYPGAEVSAKLSFAAKSALVGEGASVSDRVPALAIGDAEVLTRLSPELAYPAACQRYVASAGLRDTDVLFALVSLDPQETIIHAGLCVDGAWTWIR